MRKLKRKSKLRTTVVEFNVKNAEFEMLMNDPGWEKKLIST